MRFRRRKRVADLRSATSPVPNPSIQIQTALSRRARDNRRALPPSRSQRWYGNKDRELSRPPSRSARRNTDQIHHPESPVAQDQASSWIPSRWRHCAKNIRDTLPRTPEHSGPASEGVWCAGCDRAWPALVVRHHAHRRPGQRPATARPNMSTSRLPNPRSGRRRVLT